MIALKPVRDSNHVFIVCDGCGLDIDIINSLEISGAIIRNNWRRKDGNHYCPKCPDGH